MFGAFEPVVNALTSLVVDYGLVGLFAVSAMGATIIIPFSAELAFPILLSAGVAKMPILMAATLGAYLGTAFNYWLGHKGGEIALKKMKKEDLEKAKRFMDHYGLFGVMVVMIIPLPLPVDPITILCGVAKMNFLSFSVATFLGKGIKYGILLWLLSAVL